jgi:hypothetical protein
MKLFGRNLKIDFKARDITPVALSILALLLSLASYLSSSVSNRDVAGVDAIKSEYAVFLDLTKLQLDHPLTTHLFALTEEGYAVASATVKTAASGLDSARRAMAILEEQAVAHYIFTIFELTYYQLDHARAYQDLERTSFYSSDMQWFDDAMCNARLQWYWDVDNGMKMALGFSTDLQRYVSTQVKRGCSMNADPAGPLT